MTKQQEFDKLVSRRTELGSDLKGLSTRREELAAEYGAAILSGTNGDKLEAELTKADAKRAGIENAIRLADKQLNQLTADIQAEKQAAAKAEAEKVIATVLAAMRAASVDLHALNDKSQGWYNRLTEAASLADRNGMKDLGYKANNLFRYWPYQQIELALQVLAQGFLATGNTTKY